MVQLEDKVFIVLWTR